MPVEVEAIARCDVLRSDWGKILKNSPKVPFRKCINCGMKILKISKLNRNYGFIKKNKFNKQFDGSFQKITNFFPMIQLEQNYFNDWNVPQLISPLGEDVENESVGANVIEVQENLEKSPEVFKRYDEGYNKNFMSDLPTLLNSENHGEFQNLLFKGNNDYDRNFMINQPIHLDTENHEEIENQPFEEKSCSTTQIRTNLSEFLIFAERNENGLTTKKKRGRPSKSKENVANATGENKSKANPENKSKGNKSGLVAKKRLGRPLKSKENTEGKAQKSKSKKLMHKGLDEDNNNNLQDEESNKKKSIISLAIENPKGLIQKRKPGRPPKSKETDGKTTGESKSKLRANLKFESKGNNSGLVAKKSKENANVKAQKSKRENLKRKELDEDINNNLQSEELIKKKSITTSAIPKAKFRNVPARPFKFTKTQANACVKSDAFIATSYQNATRSSFEPVPDIPVALGLSKPKIVKNTPPHYNIPEVTFLDVSQNQEDTNEFRDPASYVVASNCISNPALDNLKDLNLRVLENSHSHTNIAQISGNRELQQLEANEHYDYNINEELNEYLSQFVENCQKIVGFGEIPHDELELSWSFDTSYLPGDIVSDVKGNSPDSIGSYPKYDLRQSIINHYKWKVDDVEKQIRSFLIPHVQNYGMSTLDLYNRVQELKRRAEKVVLVRNRTEKKKKCVRFSEALS